MANFKITAELMNNFCKEGLTVSEMASKITELSGQKCSPNTVREAAKHYKISLKAKPRKSAFEFDEVTNSIQNTEEAADASINEAQVVGAIEEVL